MSRFQQRRNRLRKLVRKEQAEAMLVTDASNVTYLTGFTGDSSYLLLTPRDEIVLSDPRYTIQLEEECPAVDLEIRQPGVKITESVAKTVKAAKVAKLAVEGASLTVDGFESLGKELPRIEFVRTSGLVEQLREIKDKLEVAEIRNAVALAERAFAVIKASLRGEQTEKEIADALEHQIRLFGGRGCSFTPIVGVGDRAALAHYQPGAIRVEQSNLLLIDWGAYGQLYLSDLTRVLVTGKPTTKLERIYKIVLAAQTAAIQAIRPGAVMADVDAVARRVIHDAGYGKRFGHSLGHGIGLQIHEQPRLAVDQKRPLRAGMVVTVEPGIYLPGWGGVRIEDDVLVTSSGHEVLSSVPKEFAECIVNQ